MSDWGHESEDLFRSARRGLSPSAGDRERVRARIRAKVGAAAVGVAATGAAAKAAGATSGAGAASTGAGAAGAAGAGAAAKGLSLALLVKIAVPVVMAGAGLAAAPHVLASRAPAAHLAVAPVSAPAPAAPVVLPAVVPDVPVAPQESVAVDALPTVVTAPVSPPAPRAVAAAPRPVPPVATSPAAAAAAAPSPANEGEEAALVGAIDVALRSGDSAGALRLAADHQRRFPQGVLSEEREGARVVARCMSARSPAASEAASAFLASHPRSPMRARIAATCGTTEPR